jgi:hypothetical protein
MAASRRLYQFTCSPCFGLDVSCFQADELDSFRRVPETPGAFTAIADPGSRRDPVKAPARFDFLSVGELIPTA